MRRSNAARDGAGAETALGSVGGSDAQGLRAILSRGADPAPTTRGSGRPDSRVLAPA